MDEGDSLSIVFHTALDAMRFALISQEDLLTAEWPTALLQHPSGARDGLYAGLRVRMAVECGHASKFLNKSTNRLSYEGPAVQSCSDILKMVDDGGIVVTSTHVVQALQERFSHRLYELGQYHMQDLGTFDVPSGEGSVSLVQMMPV